MKKILCFILCAIVLCAALFPFSVYADDSIEVTLQPQNYHYCEGSVAMYTVRASGTGLKFTWFIRFNGYLYDMTNGAGQSQPWEAYAGADYGQTDSMFESTYHFSGILEGLSGASIYCHIENDTVQTNSAEAVINVSGKSMPPVIEVPAMIEVEQNGSCTIECSVSAVSIHDCNFQWYVSGIASMPSMKAILDRPSNGQTYIPDTSKTGLMYYCCGVTTDQGGIAYSSIIPVTVKKKTDKTDVVITTDSLPDATEGKEYSAKIECTDKKAEISIYYNPGKNNDFELTDLKLKSDGTITGTPKKAGTYIFTVQANGKNGSDYKQLSLTVKAAAVPESSASETEHPITGEMPSETKTEPTSSGTQTATGSETQSASQSGTGPSQTITGSSETEASGSENQITMPRFTTGANSSDQSSGMPSWIWILIIIIVILVIVNIALLLKKKQ